MRNILLLLLVLMAAPALAGEPVTVTMAGDCTLGEFKGQSPGGLFREVFRQKGPKWPFGGVGEYFRTDDLTFVNLEGPLTSIPQKVVKKFPIKGDPVHVQALVEGSVEVVNLSNNHILDCGRDGLADTLRVLSRAGIAYAGEGHVYETTVRGVTIAFFGYNGWSADPGLIARIRRDLAASRAHAKIVEFHWGVERTYRHNAVQERLAHAAADAGASFVVGAHPHVVQDVQVYKGVPIVYSMGNFVFGANKNPADKDSMLVRARFTRGGLLDWQVIPARLSSVPHANDYRPVIVKDERERQRILRKVGL